ncbi:MAG: hypothetical protein ACTSYI_04895 [Promethearchaeota archaeon]
MTSTNELKEEILKNPAILGDLNAFQLSKMSIKFSKKELQFITDYNNGIVDINNNPIGASLSTSGLSNPTDFSGRYVRSEHYHPKLNTFLATGGILLLIYLVIVFTLPDFIASTATFNDYLIRIGSAVGFTLVVGGIISLLITNTGTMKISAAVAWWTSVVVYIGLVVLFSFLISGLDLAQLELWIFALASVISIPLCALLGGFVIMASGNF